MSFASEPPAENTHSHPAPGLPILYYGLLLPPLAWVVEQLVNFGLASHACFPQGTTRASFLPGWEGVWSVLLAVNVALLILCAIGIPISWLSWRNLVRKEQGTDNWGRIFEPLEGRLRVFAASSLLVASLFTIAIAFNTISLAALSTCSQA